MEKALTLKEVAELLGLSYGTIFVKRHQIGFRLPGSRVWRVWPADLEKLRPQMSTPLPPITVRDYGAPLMHQPFQASAAREASEELDRLLAQGRKPKKNGNP